jgi:phosphatidylserine/phosphatidylglycerophosphate/cardiolipin synthase-like enzyme
MHRRTMAPAVGLAALAFLVGLALPLEGGGPRTTVKALFSPKGGVQATVIEEIKKAEKTLDVALYMLTAPRLGEEIVIAHKRGVKVRVLLDRRQSERWSQLQALRDAGVPAWTVLLPKGESDPSDPQFHHKFAVIDGRTVLTGSFNWTVMADERNHENLVVIRDSSAAAAFTEAFEKGLKAASAKEGD